ncbi:hypothetical protein LCGC14_0087360 [marine sediment metagenome]|uniref:Peptidase S8/S53 domain-containing protein n=1 Tax=marine sediment metagenome TaxID=412755 RepID=A0A0F9VWM0_9ZZZZ|nr:S8 family peptidase [Halomonas sp.]HDZ46430.1 S8 family peptidase [Halomonas sp.]HEB06196.1 S8 family peptidase [Halomonas sp.]
MSNNPVQVVLNSQDYVEYVQPNPGGGNTDFYAGRDKEFKQHKEKLINSIDKIFAKSQSDQLIYAYIELWETAWAKSHRPKALFPPSKIRLFSGDNLGALYAELAIEDQEELKVNILSAEDETNWVYDDNRKKPIAKPSSLRSAVGAIKSIRSYETIDKRKFSLDQAIDWLSDNRTGGGYYVEIFIQPKDIEKAPNKNKRDLALNTFSSFIANLNAFDDQINFQEIESNLLESHIFLIKPLENNRKNHLKILDLLDNHPAVRSVLLPPILQASDVGSTLGEAANIPDLFEENDYPVVGIVDTGVASLEIYNNWEAGKVNFISSPSQDKSHGTFIAGLVAFSKHLNQDEVFNEAGCKFYDLALHPTTNYGNYYPNGFIDFLEQLDEEIPAAIEAGVRVFNMSLAVVTPVEDQRYSIFASAVDKISDKHDILFVLPAGNITEKTHLRGAWPEDIQGCINIIDNYPYPNEDLIYQPADSVRSITVGALDPADVNGRLKPSRYSRRGPGPSLGAKPDVAHIGGALSSASGLKSLAVNGFVCESFGTSYAAPLVAKTLAVLNHSIEGRVSKEALVALLLHHSNMPNWLENKKLKNVAKNLVGVGVPQPAINSLVIDDSEVTLVFSGTLFPRHKLSFEFSWPTSLVSKGSCRGNVKITTVYRPAIDRSHGAEFVRANTDTRLRQEQFNRSTGEAIFRNKLSSPDVMKVEKERIEQGAKWWPVKTIEKKFKGVGDSSQWRLVLEPLARDGYAVPNEGIPFSAVMTISDPDGRENIFHEMRQQLQASGVKVSDIRNALTYRLRN